MINYDYLIVCQTVLLNSIMQEQKSSVIWVTSLASTKVDGLVSHQLVSTYKSALLKETLLSWNRKLYENSQFGLREVCLSLI